MAYSYPMGNDVIESRGTHPVKFVMWLYIGSIIMIFAALTSALLVSRADNLLNGSWAVVTMPIGFSVTTAIIILSSLSLLWATKGAKDNNLSQLNLGIWITIFLGILFLIGQVISYNQLMAAKVFLVGNVSGSFLYVITGIHAVHLVGGLIFLVVLAIQALRLRVNSEKILSLELCNIFWHALGLLWIYLFVFLSVIYS